MLLLHYFNFLSLFVGGPPPPPGGKNRERVHARKRNRDIYLDSGIFWGGESWVVKDFLREIESGGKNKNDLK